VGLARRHFGRALADRFTREAAGQTLRLGSVELWFNAACLAVTLVGVMWSLRVGRPRSLISAPHRFCRCAALRCFTTEQISAFFATYGS
jgi:hypothetical protein